MPYYSQTKTDVRCGAYSIAYWIWNKQNRALDAPVTEAERNLVEAIYQEVKFTDADLQIMGRVDAGIASKMNGFSNPYRMSAYLSNSLGEDVRVVTSDANMHELLKVINPNQSKEQLEDLRAGASAILVMHNSANMPQHYIFAVGQANGLVTIIDPANGIPVADQANLTGLAGTAINGLYFYGTLICK